jgi:ethanolamine ammonia-lyase large subunit
MLNYQSTSFHDAAGVRSLFGLRPAPEFLAWLEAMGSFEHGRLALADRCTRQRLLERLDTVLDTVA